MKGNSSSRQPADLIVVNASRVYTMEDSPGAAGKDGFNTIENPIEYGAVAVKDGIIKGTGTTEYILERFEATSGNILDAQSRLVLPGFVDSHTHLIFGGERSGELQQRLAGASYLDILKSGGGIYSTVKATREASPEELYETGYYRLDRMMRNGTTAAEIKSGYGLDYENELKILKTADLLKRNHPADISVTYLGAHAFPDGYTREEYLGWLTGSSLKEFRKYADFCDVFCEDGAFTSEESEALLKAAASEGFGLKIHAGQFNDIGGAGLAADYSCISADHLENVSDSDLAKMSRSGTVAVFLPGVPFYLQSSKYPDGERFLSGNIPVAVATDFNPGSCPSYSMQMMITLAVFNCGLSVEQAAKGATLNSARALGKDSSLGSLKTGKKADILIMDVEDLKEIPYYFGTNLVAEVIKDGKVL